MGGKVGLPGPVAANAPGARARGSILPEDKEGASTPDNIIDDLKTKTPTIYRLFQGMYAKDPAKARQQVIRQYGEGSVADGIHSHFTQGKLEASMVRVAQRNLVKAFYRLKRAEADRDLRQLSRTFGLR